MSNGKISKIEGGLRTLEDLDLESISLSNAAKRVENLFEIIQLMNTPESSPFYQRLDYIAERIDKYFREIQDYFGIVEGSIVRVVMNGRLIVTRVYGRDLKIKWGFNQKGRIDYVKYYGMNYSDKSLIEVLGSEENPEWFVENASRKPMPENSYLINSGIPRQHPRKQIQSIIRFGHGILKEISQGGNIREFELRRGQKRLEEIYEDESTIDIVDAGAVIFPTVINYGLDTITIRYREN